jgi:hypothetical protein
MRQVVVKSPAKSHAKLAFLATALLCVLACQDDTRAQKKEDAMSKSSGENVQSKGQVIAQKIGLTLPPGASFELADYTDGQDDSARIIVRMPRADWEMLAKTPSIIDTESVLRRVALT